jgi:hypothetical protein
MWLGGVRPWVSWGQQQYHIFLACVPERYVHDQRHFARCDLLAPINQRVIGCIVYWNESLLFGYTIAMRGPTVSFLRATLPLRVRYSNTTSSCHAPRRGMSILLFRSYYGAHQSKSDWLHSTGTNHSYLGISLQWGAFSDSRYFLKKRHII